MTLLLYLNLCRHHPNSLMNLNPLGNNTYLSGTISPRYISTLQRRLQGLTLHNNQFIGSIPTQIGTLTSLDHLNLSYNQFTGQIPTEIAQLTRLGKRRRRKFSTDFFERKRKHTVFFSFKGNQHLPNTFSFFFSLYISVFFLFVSFCLLLLLSKI